MACIFLFIPEGVSVMTVALMGWMWRLRLLGIVPFDPGELQTEQPGSIMTPAPRRRWARVWSHSQLQPDVPTSRKPPRKRGRGKSRHSRTNPPAYLRELASTQPFASSHYLRKRHYRFHPRRSYAQRSLTSEFVIEGALIPLGDFLPCHFVLTGEGSSVSAFSRECTP